MGLRAWSAFPGHVGNAIAFMLLGGVLNMLAFFNSTVLNYRFGIVGMGARLVELYLKRVAASPIAMAAVVCFAIGLDFAGKAPLGEKVRLRRTGGHRPVGVAQQRAPSFSHCTHAVYLRDRRPRLREMLDESPRLPAPHPPLALPPQRSREHSRRERVQCVRPRLEARASRPLCAERCACGHISTNR